MSNLKNKLMLGSRVEVTEEHHNIEGILINKGLLGVVISSVLGDGEVIVYSFGGNKVRVNYKFLDYCSRFCSSCHARFKCYTLSYTPHA